MQETAELLALVDQLSYSEQPEVLSIIDRRLELVAMNLAGWRHHVFGIKREALLDRLLMIHESLSKTRDGEASSFCDKKTKDVISEANERH